MKYLVTEIQCFEGGTTSTPSYSYDTRNEAEAKFYTILATAALSTLPKHGAIIFTDEGVPIMHECYIHESN